MTAGRFAKKTLGVKKLRYFEAPAARALRVATSPESWGRIKLSGGIRLPKGEPRPDVYCPWSLQSPWEPPGYWYYRPVRSVWVPRSVVPEPKDGLIYVFAGEGEEGDLYGVWQLVLKREEPKVLTLGSSEPRRWPIKPRRRASTPVRTKIRRRYSTEAPRWGKATDDFAPLAHFPRHHKVSTTPPPTVEEVLYHVEQHRVEAEAKPLTAAEEVLYHVERHRLAFLNLFTNWGHGKPLELGPPTFPANIFDTDPKLAMFWAKRLDTNKYPELNVNWQWRRGGVREALHDQARKSRWISKERRRQINRAHYFNGLMVLTPHLTKPPKTRFPYPREAKLPGELRWRRIWVAPPVVYLQTWRAPVDVVSYSGKMIKRAGERINLGTEATEDASRVIARQRAKRRQLETAYTVAGYVSAATGRRNITLSRALESVSAHYENDDRFRAALNAELPGAVILAASDGLAPDLEYGTEKMKGDVVEDRYRRSTKAYNERLRKLGYLDWDDEASWGEFPEEKSLPEPLETEVQRLTQDAKSWVLYANRHCRTDFADVVRIRDGDERRKLVPDTRSDGTDPANGYQDTRGWQLWDRKHQPDPAEYDIEAAMAEGDVEVAGSEYATEAAAKEWPWKYEFGGMDSLAVTPPEEDEKGEFEEDYSPDFSTHHAAGRIFDQRIAVQGFREFALKYEPEKYATAHKMGALPDYERQQLCPSYRDAVLLDLLGKRRLPEIDEDGSAGACVRYEDEGTGERYTVKTSKLADLRHELDGEGPSRFGLTDREREAFGCYYGTSDMTVAAIAKRLNVTDRTVKRAMAEVRKKLAQAGIPLPAQAERRGRKAV